MPKEAFPAQAGCRKGWCWCWVELCSSSRSVVRIGRSYSMDAVNMCYNILSPTIFPVPVFSIDRFFGFWIGSEPKRWLKMGWSIVSEMSETVRKHETVWIRLFQERSEPKRWLQMVGRSLEFGSFVRFERIFGAN